MAFGTMLHVGGKAKGLISLHFMANVSATKHQSYPSLTNKCASKAATTSTSPSPAPQALSTLQPLPVTPPHRHFGMAVTAFASQKKYQIPSLGKYRPLETPCGIVHVRHLSFSSVPLCKRYCVTIDNLPYRALTCCATYRA